MSEFPVNVTVKVSDVAQPSELSYAYNRQLHLWYLYARPNMLIMLQSSPFVCAVMAQNSPVLRTRQERCSHGTDMSSVVNSLQNVHRNPFLLSPRPRGSSGEIRLPIPAPETGARSPGSTSIKTSLVALGANACWVGFANQTQCHHKFLQSHMLKMWYTIDAR